MDIAEKLYSEGIRLRTLAEKSREDRRKRDALTKSLGVYSDAAKQIVKQDAELKLLEQTLTEYLSERKTKGLSNLRLGIEMAKQIIPEGDLVDLDITEDGEAYVVNKTDRTVVEDTEGSGNNSMISMFLRDRLLSSTNYLKCLILDEICSKLSQENTAKAAKFIKFIGEQKQVLIIEHKPEIYLDIPGIVYKVEKIGGVSYIDRIESVSDVQ